MKVQNMTLAEVMHYEGESLPEQIKQALFELEQLREEKKKLSTTIDKLAEQIMFAQDDTKDILEICRASGRKTAQKVQRILAIIENSMFEL